LEKRSLPEMFNVGVVGAGYVGLVTGACLAHIGHRVTCVDKDERRIASLKEGRIPFYEPGLGELIGGSTRRRRLRFAADLAEVIPGVDVVFIAVGTPQGDDGSVDLSDVAAVARGIGKALSSEVGSETARPLVVANKSTVPVGTGNYVSMLL
jgi:UDPglucose 6-dehydrogenase